MKQFAGRKNKGTPLSITPDGNFHNITLPGLNADTKFVTVEILTQATAGTVGIRPVGTTLPDSTFEFNTTVSGYTTTTVLVDSSDRISCSTTTTGIQFSVIGEWGGNAVVSLGVDPIPAPGWTLANSSTWRDVSLSGIVDNADLGNTEAVLCYVVEGTPALPRFAGVRGNGSTWSVGQSNRAASGAILKAPSGTDSILPTQWSTRP